MTNRGVWPQYSCNDWFEQEAWEADCGEFSERYSDRIENVIDWTELNHQRGNAMKRYGFNKDTEHQAIIFEVGSEADNVDEVHDLDTEGLIVGSSEWGWISEDNGRRICAALQFFSETSTEEIERLANERFPPELRGRRIDEQQT